MAAIISLHIVTTVIAVVVFMIVIMHATIINNIRIPIVIIIGIITSIAIVIVMITSTIVVITVVIATIAAPWRRLTASRRCRAVSGRRLNWRAGRRRAQPNA